MTDKEQLKALLLKFGVHLTDSEEKEVEADQGKNFLCVEADDSDKGRQMGYHCFFVDFNFDKDGNFINMGIWE